MRVVERARAPAQPLLAPWVRLDGLDRGDDVARVDDDVVFPIDEVAVVEFGSRLVPH